MLLTWVPNIEVCAVTDFLKYFHWLHVSSSEVDAALDLAVRMGFITHAVGADDVSTLELHNACRFEAN